MVFGYAPDGRRIAVVYEEIDDITESPVASSVANGKSRPSTPASTRKRRGRTDWLSPLPLAREVADEHREVPIGRASNKGCLPMSLVDYLQLHLIGSPRIEIRGDADESVFEFTIQGFGELLEPPEDSLMV